MVPVATRSFSEALLQPRTGSPTSARMWPIMCTVGPASFGALVLSRALGPCQGVSLSSESLAVRPARGLRLPVRPMPPGARGHGEYARLSDPLLRCCNFEWRSRLVVVFSFASCPRPLGHPRHELS